MADTYRDKLKDPRWQRRRLEVFNRDGWACTACGATDRTLHVHHEAYVGDPWDAPDEAVRTLCDDCHRAEHRTENAWAVLLARIIQHPTAGWHSFPALHELAAEAGVAPGVLRQLLALIPESGAVSTARLLEMVRSEPWFARLAVLACQPLEDESAHEAAAVAVAAAHRLRLGHVHGPTSLNRKVTAQENTR